MSKPLESGYCNWCAENTEHGHYAKSPISAFGHSFVRLFAGSGGYGPWYCSGCRRVSTVIVPPVEQRKESSIDDVTVQQPTEGSLSKPDVSQAVIPQASDSRRPVTQPTRKSQTSKISQSSSRYSQKYRFAVARRIIDGHATFKQIGEELSISKREIWSWLVEHFRDNQHQIAQLKKQVRLMEESTGTTAPKVKSDQQIVSCETEAEPSWSTTVVVDGQQLDSP